MLVVRGAGKSKVFPRYYKVREYAQWFCSVAYLSHTQDRSPKRQEYTLNLLPGEHLINISNHKVETICSLSFLFVPFSSLIFSS
jgi:hypothetical protein